MNERSKARLDEFAAKQKREVREYRRSLPLRRRVAEYLLDWKVAILLLAGRKLNDQAVQLRKISSDPAWLLIRLSHRWRW